ncbi:putative 5'-nucleotidase [Austwickia chelonae NBRC 105200]|uniref:Putative 5'-nucleotidase n=1 Tax=Austwickia chelonae NBRC 105200 TaxID=1184607 RepID=K6VM38_9MICO|nr:putative 5'-nucleotidase [Austwickia chelonae NBRC 105200]
MPQPPSGGQAGQQQVPGRQQVEGLRVRAAVRADRAAQRKVRQQARDQRAYERTLKDVQLLAFNDFHGNLEPPTGSSGRVTVGHTVDAAGKVSAATVDAGGAAYLSTHLKRLRDGQQTSFTVAAGDQIGGSPLLSAAFYDEPTMEALSAMKVDAASVGNHEFDKGYKELLRIVKGGCVDDGEGKNNRNSCALHKYAGSSFPLLAANVYQAGTKKPILPAYTVMRKNGVQIGVIGVVLKDTANVVSHEGVKGITFGDEVEAINRATAELRSKGVNAVVALVHEGGSVPPQPWKAPNGKSYQVTPPYDARCSQGSANLLAGSPVLPIARKVDAGVDAILTAHSHQAYLCDVPDPQGRPRPVTQALALGRLITNLHFKYDPATKDVVRDRTWTRQQIVSRDVPADPQIQRIVSAYTAKVKPIADRGLGTISADVTRVPNAAGESQLGDLVADAQLADPGVAAKGAPAVAFMNPGGIRADLLFAPLAGEKPGTVTFRKAFSVQPFGNNLVSMDLAGEQLYALLNQQFTGKNAGDPKVLQVSKGFEYVWTAGPKGPRVVDGSVKIAGKPVDRKATYRVVANSFLADGGDGFAAFAQGRNRITGSQDLDSFAKYLEKHASYTPAPLTRITKK